MTVRNAGLRSDRIRFWRTSISKWQLKVLLTVFGLGIMGAVLLYTKSIVDELVANERRTVKLYAELLKQFYEKANDEDLLFYVEIAQSSITFPVILTDKRDQPIYPYPQFMMNVELDTTMSVSQQKQWLVDYIAEMRTEYPPFEILDQEGKVIQRLFYTNSAIIGRLRFMPYVEILIVAAFILVGYVAFSTIRRNEESNIWVGMAKEAAHQLGTPLSSLLAWLEILRMESLDPKRVETTSYEMERDVARLNVIANRFAKIGSPPKLERVVLSTVIEHVADYFESRLPNLGKKVQIRRTLDASVISYISLELFEWVIENLIKNAVEAIERNEGLIEIELKSRDRGGAIVIIRDNGRGMSRQIASKVFQPGYTTKRRGWGLGLSLSRRIVEDYHGGKLAIRETQVGVGTTFCIELPNSNK